MDTKKFRTKTLYRKMNYPSVPDIHCIGLDIGYSGVKLCTPSLAATFPSYAKKEHAEYLGEPEDSMIIYQNLETGEYWTVGEDAQESIDIRDTSDSENALYGRERYYSPMFRVLVETGMGIACVNEHNKTDLFVQTGLPSKYIKMDTDMLKDVIEGRHYFSIKVGRSKERVFDFTIPRDHIDVMQQPMGTLFSVMTGDDGEFLPSAMDYFNRNVIVFDAGFGTLDIVPIRRHRIGKPETFDNLGMKQVLKDTVDQINEMYHQDISVAAMQKFLKRGTFRMVTRKDGRIQSEDIPFDDILAECNKNVCMEAIRQLEQVVPITEFDYLIITGGTCAAWNEMIKDYFSGMQTLKIINGNINGGLGHIFANARGYFMYRYGMLKREG